jgi:RND family efflux transporter MFP subunit
MSTATLKRSDLERALSKKTTVREQVQAAEVSAGANKFWRALIASGVIIGGIVLAAMGSRLAGVHAEAEVPARPMFPLVSTARPERSQQTSELSLPGEIEAYQSTSIYARIGGYLKAWKVDRGDRVTQGQTLAIIDAPEFDQELRRSQADLQQGKAEADQARTELAQAQANVDAGKAQILRAEAVRDLADKTEDRFKEMVKTWAASQQQYDEAIRNHATANADVVVALADLVTRKSIVDSKQAAINTAEARVNSLEATVARLKELESFKTITAPFEGTITKRYVDVGAYISADGAKPLFTIIQDDMLRVNVNVPQTYAPSMTAQQQATVTLRELPGRKFMAKVARTARAIDSAARTLTVELDLPNNDRSLLAGSFAQVKFAIGSERAPLTIPVNTLKLSKNGTQVVVVDGNHHLQLRKVELGRDMGSRVEVLTGLVGNEDIVINPADSMSEGTEVESAGGSEVAAK